MRSYDLEKWPFRYQPWLTLASTLFFVIGIWLFVWAKGADDVDLALFGLFAFALGGSCGAIQYANFLRQHLEGRITELEKRLDEKQ